MNTSTTTPRKKASEMTTNNEDILSDTTIKHLMDTVAWLVRESDAGRKPMQEANDYYEDVIRLIERSAAASGVTYAELVTRAGN
jgi:hypothetical protein